MTGTVIQIIADHLRDNGYGGLVQADSACGCELSDLRPCDSDFSACKAGYKHCDPRPGREDVWLICVSLEPPSLGAFDTLGD